MSGLAVSAGPERSGVPDDWAEDFLFAQARLVKFHDAMINKRDHDAALDHAISARDHIDYVIKVLSR